MTEKRPTINDVAHQAGVSKATVSAVLNGTGSISDATRARVLAVAERLNYRAVGPGRRGGAQKGRSIGLLIREMENPFYADVVAGMRAVADRHGYTVVVASSEGDYAAEQQAVDLLREQGVDGLLLYAVLNNESDLSHLFDLKRRNFPFILLEAIWGVQASLVDIDNTAASRKAVEYLISLGHTRIVHFAGPEYSMHRKERLDGVYRAFSGSHLVFSDDAVIQAGAHLEDGYRVGLRYFGELPASERPTAVTCYNDMVAIGLCRALSELGIRVPEDVSVVGYDDIPILDYLATPLTTVRIPKFEMGEQATEMLIRHIESQQVPEPQRIHFEADLVVRASTRSLAEEKPARTGRLAGARGSTGAG